MRTNTAAQLGAARGAQPLAGSPANEAGSHVEAPSITVTDAQKKRYGAQAMALDASKVLPLPSHLSAKLVWMGIIQATAWRDRAAFAEVADEDQPLTAQELEDLGRRIEFARDLEAGRTLPVRGDGADVTKMSDGAIWSEMRAHRATLCAALALRFAKDPGLRDTVVAIRGATRQLDVTRALRQLLRVFEDAAMAAWAAKLPKGEGPALARLQALHLEWGRRRAHGAAPSLTATSDDLVRRAYTLAAEPLERVLRVGRYLTRGVEGRDGDYGHFRAPVKHRPAKVVAPKKPPVTDPDGKPTG